MEEGRRVTRRMDSLAFLFPNLFTSDGLLQQGSRARFMLNLGGLQIGANQALCPITQEALVHVPGLVSAGFYLLGPQSVIKPHRGAGEQFLRVHLGVVVPAGCALKVAGQVRAWQEGQFLIFDDSFEHEAWNHSDRLRCVFHFDFFHGVPTQEHQARLSQLRHQVVRSAPTYHAPLLQAGVEAEDNLLAIMNATVEEARRQHPSRTEGQLAQLRQLVEGNGLYLGY